MALEKWRTRRAIKRIRRELAFWGHDISEYSDDDIIEAFTALATALGRNAGVSIDEAVSALTTMTYPNKEIPHEQA